MPDSPSNGTRLFEAGHSYACKFIDLRTVPCDYCGGCKDFHSATGLLRQILSWKHRTWTLCFLKLAPFESRPLRSGILIETEEPDLRCIGMP